MENWRVELCEDEARGWWWICTSNGSFVCWSRKYFRHEWQAKRDYDRQVEDHCAVMKALNRN